MSKLIRALPLLALVFLPSLASAQVTDVPFFSAKRMVLSLGVQEHFEFAPVAKQTFEVGPVFGYRLTKNLSTNLQAFVPLEKGVVAEDVDLFWTLRWRVWDGSK